MESTVNRARGSERPGDAAAGEAPIAAMHDDGLVVSEVDIHFAGDRARLSAMVRCGASAESWWFDVPRDAAESVRVSGNPWLVAVLPLAAAIGGTVSVAAPVDARLLDNLQRMLEIWRAWYPWMRDVRFACEAPLPVRAGERRTGAFLSGGVDSLFTALRPRAHAVPDERVQIDELISVRGFDIPLANGAAFDRLRERHRGLARELGCTFTDVATNLRETRLREVSWGWVAHGCALAACALALDGRYDTVLIPATGGYRDLHPWASHPLTDPLLSTSGTSFVHDGAAFTRVDKSRLLAQSPMALAALRVCWESRSDENCGRCNKCLRTMAVLECMGALARCTTFPESRLDVSALARVRCVETWDYREFRDLRELALGAGRHDVARAATRAMRRSRRRDHWHAALKRLAAAVRRATSMPPISTSSPISTSPIDPPRPLTGADRPTASRPRES